MNSVQLVIPKELADAASDEYTDLSQAASRLLALDLYRAGKVSLGKASELCAITGEEFVDFASSHGFVLNYDAAELEADRRTLERLGL